MVLTNNLKKIFTLQIGKPYLKTRESSTVEYKESFNFAGMAGYAKHFAAFTNNSGGYIVFGVKNRPHIPVGLQNDHFENIDEARITEIVNQHFSPAIDWTKDMYIWNKNRFGIIYVYEANNKPVIAIKDGGKNQEIKDGEIYYRYAGRTEKIRYAEMKQIIDEKIQNERRAWQSLFERIAKIGPENAALLNTAGGKIEGGKRNILIDDELLPKLNFIREGQFEEKEGAITLKLIGDVQPVSVVGIKEKVVQYDPYRLKASNVVEQVARGIQRTLRVNPEHLKCWKYYRAREYDDKGKVKCNPKYCEYKEAFNNYAYTQDWVDFLIKELSDPEKYHEVISSKI